MCCQEARVGKLHDISKACVKGFEWQMREMRGKGSNGDRR